MCGDLCVCVCVFVGFFFTFQRLFGEDLPLLQSGFVSVTELVSAMSDAFHLIPAEHDNGQHWIVMDIQDNDITQSGVLHYKYFVL